MQGKYPGYFDYLDAKESLFFGESCSASLRTSLV